MTAVLSTAGGVAFVGDMDRAFRAIDVKTGKVLWETRLGTSVQGFPLTFSIARKAIHRGVERIGRRQPAHGPHRARSRSPLPFVRECAVRIRAAGEEITRPLETMFSTTTFRIKARLAAAVIPILTLTSIVTGQQPRTVDANVLKVAGTANDPMASSWLSYGRTQGETRYSPLDQINTSNVDKLGLSWSYVLGAGGGNRKERR